MYSAINHMNVLLLLCNLYQVCVNVVVGHSARWREKKTSKGYTHDWTLFVRGKDDKDISHFVKEVVFHIHNSFPNPKRGVWFKQPSISTIAAVRLVFVVAVMFTLSLCSTLTHATMLTSYIWAMVDMGYNDSSIILLHSVKKILDLAYALSQV